MNESGKYHAFLEIIVNADLSSHDEVIPSSLRSSPSFVQAKLSGCMECLENALTHLLLHDEKVKDLVNRAIRAANEIKAKSQN